MVQFNELRINTETTKLIIDVSIKDSTYYKNVYIDSISIDTQDTFIESGPSGKVVYNKKLTGDNKSLKLELGIESLLPSLLDNMFFVWVKTKGIPDANTPCGEDNTLTLGVAVALYPLYQHALGYIKELGDACIMPKGFINFLLQLKALQIAIKTGHYTLAIKYWEKFFKNVKREMITNRCNCNGRIG